jgi:gluconate 2-dehydrogenase gamma chain
VGDMLGDTLGLMTRRAALARVAYLLGGALAAPTVAGVLAGCGAAPDSEGTSWVPRTLSPEQREAVLTMGEIILPQTDTPGARAARVDRFIDAMLSDYYTEADRRRFLSGLERVESRAREVFGARFGALSAERQLELVQALNRQAFLERRAPGAAPSEQAAAAAAAPANPVVAQNDVQTGTERTRPTLDSAWHADDTGPGSFFRTLKELVLVGYYTSEAGATKELHVTPMGTWRADIPYDEIGSAWA